MMDIGKDLLEAFEDGYRKGQEEAHKKQIPYTPKPYKNWDGQCKCGVIFTDKKTNYCGNCGQKLDWEDE
jgi:hypothetical protein